MRVSRSVEGMVTRPSGQTLGFVDIPWLHSG